MKFLIIIALLLLVGCNRSGSSCKTHIKCTQDGRTIFEGYVKSYYFGEDYTTLRSLNGDVTKIRGLHACTKKEIKTKEKTDDGQQYDN